LPWWPYIDQVHLHEHNWHVCVDRFIFNTSNKLVELLIMMIDLNKWKYFPFHYILKYSNLTRSTFWFLYSKFCLLEQELSCKLPRKEMHSWSMFFPHQMLNHLVIRSLPSIRIQIHVWKKKCWNLIETLSIWLILKSERKFHLGRSTTCHKTNL